MAKIAVIKPKEFLIFVNSILKIVPAAKFMIDRKECKVFMVNESGTVKAFYTISSVKANEECTFCLLDVQRLSKALKLVVEYGNNSGPIKFDYERGALKFNNGKGLTFNFNTKSEDIIERYTTIAPKNKITEKFGLIVDNKTISKVSSLAGISSSENPKLYLSCNKGTVTAEVSDKMNVTCDSIGIPVAQDDKVWGDWDQTLCLDIFTWALFSAVDCENIRISMTTRGFLSIILKKDSVNVNIISTVQRG